MDSIPEARKEEIKKIQVPNDHRLYRDQWRCVKRVLDEMFVLLSPLEDKQHILFSHKVLSPKEMVLLPSVIQSLVGKGIVSLEPPEGEYYALGEPYRLLIPNTEQFREYRAKIAEFCEFIENDGMKRFPEAYASSVLALREQKTLIQDPQAVHFNPKTATLQWLNKTISIRPDSLEHAFCLALFQYPPHQNIDWSEIYEIMEGKSPDDYKKSMASMREIIKRLNKRTRQGFPGLPKVFSWNNHCVRRNF